jgi:acetyl-CoA synthetase
MNHLITAEQLHTHGAPLSKAAYLSQEINRLLSSQSHDLAWRTLSKTILTHEYPFELHYFVFKTLFPEWPEKLDSAPAWTPTQDFIETTHLFHFMSEMQINTVKDFHQWTTQHYKIFWEKMLEKLHIQFHQLPTDICDLSKGLESPEWLKEAKLNIIDSCFNAPPNKPALIYQNENADIKIMTYFELNQLSNQIANSLLKSGLKKNDNIAINMPMNQYAVAIYLGIIKMGGVVISIADSFSAEEIRIRLQITSAKAIFTQDIIKRDAKQFPLYEKIIAAEAPFTIVLPCEHSIDIPLRPNDITWKTFLISDSELKIASCDPMAHCNILFSSGTTGTPIAIPWNHTTAIKAAADAYLHHNIQSDDVIAWPTSLGWMMGPWLVFAGFINQATIALYTHAPQTKQFGEFIQNAQVTILGVVPSLIAHWRQTQCMQGLNWNAIKLFSSSGECSNPEDMLYLMSLANYKPIIEYCGGTEIGGAYISSTVCEKNYPSLFTTPTMGLDFILIDKNGQPADQGEVALIPPSMGLSNELLNANHHDVYFENMTRLKKYPILRRHGDYLRRINNGLYLALGRVDDTMNMGGIKISSAEIERTLIGIPGITESAAIAVTLTQQGPSSLVIFAAIGDHPPLSKDIIKTDMQARINQHLNPLFKIHDIVFIPELPKTASNKIIRRMLRDYYFDSSNNKKNML